MLNNYYLTLLNISWPALGWLFLILILLGGRCIQLIKQICSEKMIAIRFKLVLKLVLLASVVAVYANMFAMNNSDWFHKPQVSRAVIKSVKADADLKRYELVLVTGEEKLTVKIDPDAAKQLQTNDLIEITYLPQAKEAVKCTVLTRQAQNGI